MSPRLTGNDVPAPGASALALSAAANGALDAPLLEAGQAAVVESSAMVATIGDSEW